MGWTRDGAGIAIAGYHTIRCELRESTEEKDRENSREKVWVGR